MTRKHTTIKSLWMSALSILLCLSMLVGSTFAWFTDTASTGVNTIVAGNLDIKLSYKNAEQTTYKEVDEQTNVFKEDTLWEPGHVEYVHLKIENVGSLALKYRLAIAVAEETGSINVLDEAFKLSDHIKYAVIEGEKTYQNSAEAAAAAETAGGKSLGEAYEETNDQMLSGDAKTVTLVAYMPTSVGNEANYKTGEAIPEIKLGIELVATQAEYESDSFGSDYDHSAELPNQVMGFDLQMSTRLVSSNGMPIVMSTEGGKASASIPDGSVQGDTEEVTATITTTDSTEESVTYNIDFVDSQTRQEVSFNQPVKVKMQIGMGLQDVKVTHTGDYGPEEFTMNNSGELEDGQYSYDAATGELIILSSSFSPYQIYFSPYKWVALVGGAFYLTLEEAMNVVPNGGSVKLLRSVALEAPLEISKSMTFNTAHNVLTNKGSVSPALFVVNEGGSLTVTGEGTLQTTRSCAKAIEVNGGYLCVEDGICIGTESAIHVTSGSAVIRSGVYNTTSDNGNTLVCDAGSITVFGGTYFAFDPTAFLANGYAVEEAARSYRVVPTEALDGVPIDVFHFPDIVFRAYVREHYDLDRDLLLSNQEAAAVTELKINLWDDKIVGIVSLIGIEYFPELQMLFCDNNQIVHVDLSKNTKLYNVYFRGCNLVTLDISNNPNLKELRFSGNYIREIDVSNLPNLKWLDVGNNFLTEIDVSNNPLLESFWCERNLLTEIDISHCKNMKRFNCSENRISKLDVGDLTAMENLSCYDNQIKELDVSKMVNMTDLSCGGNPIRVLDVSKMEALQYLWCSDCEIEELDISNCTRLKWLVCMGNKLEVLNTSALKKLNNLQCEGNQIKVLDLRNSSELEYLHVTNNQLTTLDLHPEAKVDQGVDWGNNQYTVKLNRDRTLDLSTLPGDFDVTKVTQWRNGTVNGNILTFDQGATWVTYTYNCGNGRSASFALVLEENQDRPQYTDTPDVQPDPEPEINVPIDETNFPDTGFRNYVLEFIDLNRDQKLTNQEVNNTWSIEIGEWDGDVTPVESLKGVEYFTKLTFLRCENAQLESIDVSKNTRLDSLYLAKNQLTSLDVSKNTKLIELRIEYNNITELDVSNCTELLYLEVQENQLKELDFSNNTELTSVYCNENNLTTLNINNSKWLKLLFCSQNQITTLDISNCTRLESLYCGDNKLAYLDLTGLTKLTNYNCWGNKYLVEPDAEGKFDLKDIPGFDVTKASNWSNGSIDGTVVTFNQNATYVSYSYDLGNGESAEFKLVTEDYSDGNQGGGDNWNQGGNNPDDNVLVTAIDETTFPDETFRNYILNNIDSNGDKHLNKGEIRNATWIQIGEWEGERLPLTNLKGIELFTELRGLSVINTNLEQIDLSQNTLLNNLRLQNGKLTSIDVSMLIQLSQLTLQQNMLTELDVQKCKALTNLNCAINRIQVLDLSNLTLLQQVDCGNNQITALDISNCKELVNIGCIGNQLAFLDTTGLTKLECVVAWNNKYTATLTDGKFNLKDIPGFDVTKASNWRNSNGQNIQPDGSILTVPRGQTEVRYNYDCGNDQSAEFTLCFPANEIVIEINQQNFPDEAFRLYLTYNYDSNKDGILKGSETRNIRELDLRGRGLTSLKGVELFPGITYLRADNNKLTEVDLSELTSLTYLSLDNNCLTSLDVAALTGLERLHCHNNPLTKLDLSKNTALTELRVYNTMITSLDLSNMTSLNWMSVSNNRLTSLHLPEDLSFNNFEAHNNRCQVTLDANRSFDLSTLPGFEMSRASNWRNGTVVGTVVTFDTNTERVYYTYNCGSGKTVNFELVTYPLNDVTGNTGSVNGSDTNNEATETYIEINEQNFPDENFRKYIQWNIDNGNGKLSTREIANATELRFSARGVKSLKGIEFFTELRNFEGSNNLITEADLSKNTKLNWFNLWNNQLTSLNIRGLTALTELNVGNNALTEIDLSTNTELTFIRLSNNQLACLDLSKNTMVNNVECHENKRTIVVTGGSFDLSTLSGFDVSKASGWAGGTVSGNILTVNAGVREITYTYDCGNGKSAVFTLKTASAI